MKYTRTIFIAFIATGMMLSTYFLFLYLLSKPTHMNMSAAQTNANEATAPSELRYTFNFPGVLNETSSAAESPSMYFWLSSGAQLIIMGGKGSTIVGALPENDLWRRAYNASSPEETAYGAFPQNLFRLVTRSLWGNVEQELAVNMLQIHAVDSRNRGGYSGIFLMSRYQDEDNLYYAGIRMDGGAVIKKKYKGTYYTLAETPVFTATSSYHKYSNPNLIPTNDWIALKSQTETLGDGAVVVRLFIADDVGMEYELVLEAIDTGGSNRPAIVRDGRVGIRTDYADVLFDDYIIREL